MRRPPSPIIGSLAVIVAYMLLRSGIYHFFPVTSQETWFARDAVMSVLRLSAFTTLFLFNRTWNLARFDFPLKDLGRIALWGLVPLALWAYYFSGSHGDPFAPWMIALGTLTSLIVGLCEEYTFRGPLLATLRQDLSAFSTIFLSSVIFTLYHFQAQPVSSWGMVFLTGVILANLRLRGLSLGSLALLHGLIDASYFLFQQHSQDPFSFPGLAVQNGLLAYALVTYPRSNNEEA